ncbi:MAG: hypothetical protein LBT51_09285 [Fusobacteriaceae bacterium]|jgi:hypothetical protein|nr:hypothetical protein [Fusobacteriaceae bacterium]
MKDMEEQLEEQLEEELHEFQREQEKVKNIVEQLGGRNTKQNKIVSIIFLLVIFSLLAVGLGLQKTSLNLTLQIVIITALFKIIWMMYGTQKSNHFQFWILSTLEFRINEIDKKIKRIEKLIKVKDDNGNTNNFTV